MDQEGMRLAARVMNTERLLGSERDSVSLLRREMEVSPPGRPWMLEKAIAEEKRLADLMARQLRAVRVTMETPHQLVVLVAAERIGRLGLDEWRHRARLAGGGRVSGDVAFHYAAGAFVEEYLESRRMRRAVMAEDAAADAAAATRRPRPDAAA